MSVLKKADLARQAMHTKAVAKAGTSAVGLTGAGLDLALNTGLALATKSPLAAAAALASGAFLVNKLFF